MSTQISVVCPTYNSEKYIEKTLNMLLVQEALPNEIIFCDDGSTDQTIALIEKNLNKFNAKNIPVIFLKNKHQGPAAARNRGIQAARYEWISFLDADDSWLPQKLKKMKEVIQTQDQNIILHWESKICLNGKKILQDHGKSYQQKKALTAQLFKDCFFSTSAITIKKSLLDRLGGFDETLWVSQDYELWLRLSPFLKLTIVPEVLGFYIETVGSITLKPYALRLRYLIKILWRHRDKGGKALFGYRVLRSFLSRQWFLSSPSKK